MDLRDSEDLRASGVARITTTQYSVPPAEHDAPLNVFELYLMSIYSFASNEILGDQIYSHCGMHGIRMPPPSRLAECHCQPDCPTVSLAPSREPSRASGIIP